MLLDRLDYVIAVAEVQNLTRAAERLHISQPALTLYLNRLESELGVKLFDRAKNPVQLTDAGRYYLEEMKKVRATTQSIRQDLQAIADPTRTLRLGIGQVRGNHWLPIILPIFCQQYPRVNVHVMQSTESRMAELLLQDKIDLVFGALPDLTLSSERQLEIVKLFPAPEPLLLAAHRAYGLVPPEVRDRFDYRRPYTIDPKSLEGLPFIVPEVSNGLYDPLHTILSSHNLHPSRTITVTNMTTGLQLTIRGLGVQLIYSVGPRFTALPDMDRLDFFVLNPMPVGHPCVAAYRPNNVKTEGIQSMIRIVQDKILPLMYET